MNGMVVKESGKEVEWRQRLARFASSGQQVKSFCEAESISTATFYRWRRQLAKAGDATAAVDFIDVGVMPLASETQSMMPCSATSTALEIRLDLGQGLVLSILRR
jgi:transposase-like protein